MTDGLAKEAVAAKDASASGSQGMPSQGNGSQGMPYLVVYFAEIVLKGRNRGRFEQQLLENLRAHAAATRGGRRFAFRRVRGRIEIYPRRFPGADRIAEGEQARQAEALDELMDILALVPGVVKIRLVTACGRALDTITTAVLERLAGALAAPWAGMPSVGTSSVGEAPVGTPSLAAGSTFRVRVRRQDKAYPLNSEQLEHHLGAAILAVHPALRVRLRDPSWEVFVQLLADRAEIEIGKRRGPGGLAVGSSGHVLCLLSGGLDSPVAAHRMMVRGCRVTFLHFHSFPFLGAASEQKAVEMTRYLARFQPRTVLVIAPFASIQRAIRDGAPEALRTLLYRRLMHRVGERVAERVGASVLISGDSLGQVASQTLANLVAVEQAQLRPIHLPLWRPLLGASKEDIVAYARRIGTFRLSVDPAPDCCTLFQPRRVETASSAVELDEAERDLGFLADRVPDGKADRVVDRIADPIADCLARCRTHRFAVEYYPA